MHWCAFYAIDISYMATLSSDNALYIFIKGTHTNTNTHKYINTHTHTHTRAYTLAHLKKASQREIKTFKK